VSSGTPERSYRLSQRAAQLEPSATGSMGARVARLKAQGISVISFSIGEPDFDTPTPIKEAAIHAINTNKTHYTPNGGLLELKKALSAWVSNEQGIEYAPNQIVTTTGAKEGLYFAFQAVVDNGDEVIIPGPYWVSYYEQVKLAGGKPIVVSTDESTGFKVTPEQLREALSDRTRVLLLNSPSNPTGSVYSAEELRALADVLGDRDILIFSDEIYADISYVPYSRWLKVAPEFTDRTLIFNGASKAYAMTGWRFGYIAGPAKLIAAVSDIQSHSSGHTSSITQHAALAAYTPSEEISNAVTEMVKAFRERRDLIGEALSNIPGVTLNPVPDGAFYVFPNVTGLLGKPLRDGTVVDNALDLANYLIDKAHIGTVAGEAFGAPGYIRLSYATSNEEILEGMRRFADAV
jgi:aspartate aminotransferase